MSAGSVEAPVQLCGFFVGEGEYAVDLMRVEEILEPAAVTPVPRGPSILEGVATLRKAVVPVVDLRKAFRVSPRPRAKPRWLLCLFGPRRVAFVVDGVSEVVRCRKSEILPPPPVTGVSARYLVGVFGPESRPKLLVNLRAVLAEGMG